MGMVEQKLPGLKSELNEYVDVFVCSASFEERCLSVARWMDRSRIGQALIGRNRRFTERVGGNFGTLREWFGDRASELAVDSDDPVLTTRRIVDSVQATVDAGNVHRVVIDITAFTHEVLLILFRVCDEVLARGTVVEFLYAPAAEYSIGDAAGEKWLSKGIREVRSVMGYPGGVVPSRGSHLVVLAGFEDYRAVRLIEELEPSYVSIGYGDSTEEGTRPHQATNEERAARVRSVLGNVGEFVFSCYDPVGAEKAIRTVVEGRRHYNTIVAPMNTKLSTLGAARAARRDQSIQICYAQADIYNYSGYSIPGSVYYRVAFEDYPIGVERGKSGG